jgi:2-iminobutanoate/2-iminopropanoate deaminase
MGKEFLATKEAPAAVGAYSQGVKAKIGEIIFVSGQLPIDPSTGELSVGNIEKETKMCLQNIEAVVKAGGATKEDIVKVNLFVKNMEDFSVINAAYAEFFGDHKPARALVEVARLPKDSNLEIEAIAIK